MPLTNYVIRCYAKGCSREAVYKIASRWSDGITSELKTYSLCCADCLRGQFHRSVEKQQACRLAAGETLEAPGIYRLEGGKHDPQLQRLREIELSLSPGGPGPTPEPASQGAH